MKKKIVVLALGLVSLIGSAIGAYALYDYNEHKPLILKCTISESPADPSRVGVYEILRIEASAYGWSNGPASGLGSAPENWSFAEEDWRDSSALFLTAHKNRFTWEEDYRKVEIDRNSGELLVSACKNGQPLNSCELDFHAEKELYVKERGSCTETAGPSAKTVKQKF